MRPRHAVASSWMAIDRLRELDLNLLVLFETLAKTRSVARSAAALGMTPSAASHALTRLRATLGDPLFVRTPRGIVPTAFAETLSGKVGEALALLDQALGSKGDFSPRTASATIKVATTDFGAKMILPSLLAKLEREAPAIEVVVRQLPIDTDDALASGRIDLMVGRYFGDSADVHRKFLFRETFMVLAHRDHPSTGSDGMSLDAYLACGHVLVSPRGRPGGDVDNAIAALGHSRRIAVRIPELLLGPHLVAESQLLLTQGQRLLASFEKVLPVVSHPLPFSIPSFDIYLVWHARTHDDPTSAWFRRCLVDAHVEAYGEMAQETRPRK